MGDIRVICDSASDIPQAELERLGLRSALIAAVSAGARRAEELGHS